METPGTTKAPAGTTFTCEGAEKAFEPGGRKYILNPDNPGGGDTPVLEVGQKLVVVDEDCKSAEH